MNRAAPAQSRRLFKGLPWVLAANVVYLGVSAVISLILPRYVSLETYSLWQLYQLYALYLGYVTFGYSDGISLRLSGRTVQEMPRQQLSAGLAFLLVGDLLAFGLLAGGFLYFADGDSGTIMAWAALGALAFVPRTTLTMAFQAAGVSHHYSTAIMIERLALVIGVVGLLASGHASATNLIIADVVSKFVSLGVALVLGRSILTTRLHDPGALLRAFLRDCADGMWVLIANLSAMLITGFARLLIIAGWGLLVFGQVSLSLQLASLFLVLINAVGISVLPNLRRIPSHRYPRAYRQLRRRMFSPLLLVLPLGYLASWLVTWWLPEYTQAAVFVAFLFPLYLYETLNRGLTAVFMKALRYERMLLITNLAGLVIAAVVSLVGTYLVHSLTVTVGGILAGLAGRAFLSERLVATRLGLPWITNWVVETLLICGYLITLVVGSPPAGIALVVAGVLAYSVAPLLAPPLRSMTGRKTRHRPKHVRRSDLSARGGRK